MPKSHVAGDTRPKSGRRRPPHIPTAVEGQLAEICRDLALEAKRMRQLQQQAEELRAVIGEWADEAEEEDSEPITGS